MDAVKFFEEYKRMCDSIGSCDSCPASGQCLYDDTIQNYAGVVAITEKWSKEHPIKTRNSEFLKRYPDALLSREGNVFICPQLIDTHYNENLHCSERDCADCKAEYWMQEVE